jgi:hypothetical protein
LHKTVLARYGIVWNVTTGENYGDLRKLQCILVLVVYWYIHTRARARAHTNSHRRTRTHVYIYIFIYLQSTALQDARRVFSLVSEVMHFLSHAYHAMSDIMCDFSSPPPRNLRCRPVLIQHSALLQAGIPIQVIKFSSIVKSLQYKLPVSGNMSSDFKLSVREMECFVM